MASRSKLPPRPAVMTLVSWPSASSHPGRSDPSRVAGCAGRGSGGDHHRARTGLGRAATARTRPRVRGDTPAGRSVRLDLAEGEDTATRRPATGIAPHSTAGDEATMSRINLRLPDHLKARIEQVAGLEGLSVNAWLVRAAAAAPRPNRRSPSTRTTRPARPPALYGLGTLVEVAGDGSHGPMAAGAPNDPQEERGCLPSIPRTDLRHLGGRRR